MISSRGQGTADGGKEGTRDEIYYSLVEQHSRRDSAQMPQGMGIHHAQKRGEIQQLQTHSHEHPGHHQSRKQRPRAVALPPPLDAEPAPHRVLDDAARHVGGHVVPVVPPHQQQVRHVRDVQQRARRRPGPQDGPPPRGRPVEPEDAHRGVVQAVHDAGAGGEVVERLRQGEVARVEDGREDPARHADLRDHLVPPPQRVGGRNVGPHAVVEAVVVRPEVAQAAEDREGLLHAQEAAEGPFAVELHDGEGRDGGGAPLGYYALAGVVAFLRAGPEEEAVVEGCEHNGGVRGSFRGRRGRGDPEREAYGLWCGALRLGRSSRARRPLGQKTIVSIARRKRAESRVLQHIPGTPGGGRLSRHELVGRE